MSDQHFAVDNIDRAGWAMRKLAEARKRREEMRLYAEREKARIDEWLADEVESIDERIAFFTDALVDFYRRERERDPRAKVTTPWGKVTSRTTQAVEWGDADALTAWAAASGEAGFIREKVTRDPDKKAIKAACTIVDGRFITPAGQEVPGVKVTEKTAYTVATEEVNDEPNA